MKRLWRRIQTKPLRLVRNIRTAPCRIARRWRGMPAPPTRPEWVLLRSNGARPKRAGMSRVPTGAARSSRNAAARERLTKAARTQLVSRGIDRFVRRPAPPSHIPHNLDPFGSMPGTFARLQGNRSDRWSSAPRYRECIPGRRDRATPRRSPRPTVRAKSSRRRPAHGSRAVPCRCHRRRRLAVPPSRS